MKTQTPRDWLLNRHEAALPRLDELRGETIERLGRISARTEGDGKTARSSLWTFSAVVGVGVIVVLAIFLGPRLWRPTGTEKLPPSNAASLPDSFVIPAAIAPPIGKSEDGAPGSASHTPSDPAAANRAGFGKVFAASELDTAPSLTLQIGAMYPEALRGSGLEGRVDLRLLINENGVVVRAEVLASSDPRFESSALDAVRKWKFRPGRIGGRNVVTSIETTVYFRAPQRP